MAGDTTVRVFNVYMTVLHEMHLHILRQFISVELLAVHTADEQVLLCLVSY